MQKLLNKSDQRNAGRLNIFILVFLFLGLLGAAEISAQVEDAPPAAGLNAENGLIPEDGEEEPQPFSEEAMESTLNSSSVELNGDYVEFVKSENKFVASGNVTIKRGGVTIYCDRVEFSQQTKLANAAGNVILESADGGRIAGDRLVYNFETMKGDFQGARFFAAPFYGTGAKVAKEDENHIAMEDGHITTCDHDKPHFKVTSRKIDIYPGEKIVARNVRMVLGTMPILYLPKFSQNLKDKQPLFLFTPGHKKEHGTFLLTQWRYYLNENFKATLHLDYREKKDFASGFDIDYKTPNTGSGILRTYYLNEVDRGLLEDPLVSGELERYKVEWRHKWAIDDSTEAIWQYYRVTDPGFLKDFFEREYEKDQNPETFFLLSRGLPKGNLSLRTDVRVNDYLSTVERLPEIQYNLANERIGDSRFYFKNISTFSNFSLKDADPSEVNKETIRMDTENQISYPTKLGFVELRPYVGGRHTYYSRTRDTAQYDSVRSIFVTGADLSTKFYKTMDIAGKFWGVDINRLRHIITPSVAYKFTTDPTIPPALLDEFDHIDRLDQEHALNFSFENKLQTKRDGKNVDLLRAVVGSDFLLKENPGTGGFHSITSEIDFIPTDWMTFFMDTNYSTVEDRIQSINFDLYLRDRAKDPRWNFGIGQRLNVDADDVITSSFDYRINPKWKVALYERVDVEHGILEEHELVLTRDLHEWEMDIVINDEYAGGTEFLLVFRLKAFPEIGFDIGKTFTRRREGAN